MIIQTSDGDSYDTEKDLTAPERHILQKLFLWESMAPSVEEFAKQAAIALRKGWNNSGPITKTQAFKRIIKSLEKKVESRIKEKDPSG
jgi:hypothetical protein